VERYVVFFTYINPYLGLTIRTDMVATEERKIAERKRAVADLEAKHNAESKN
jgi:hypothetical protein